MFWWWRDDGRNRGWERGELDEDEGLNGWGSEDEVEGVSDWGSHVEVDGLISDDSVDEADVETVVLVAVTVAVGLGVGLKPKNDSFCF